MIFLTQDLCLIIASDYVIFIFFQVCDRVVCILVGRDIDWRRSQRNRRLCWCHIFITLITLHIVVVNDIVLLYSVFVFII